MVEQGRKFVVGGETFTKGVIIGREREDSVKCYWHIKVRVTVVMLIEYWPLIRTNREGRQHAVSGSLCAHTVRVWC